MRSKTKRRFLPSNGTEGMMLIGCFCAHCIHEKFMNTQKHGDKQCEIFNNAILHNRPCYDKDLEFDGWEWFCDEDFGNWECKQYKHWDWGNDDDGWNDPPEDIPTDPNQLLLFTFDEDLDGLLTEEKKVQNENQTY